MKRFFAFLLLLCMVLTACSPANPGETGTTGTTGTAGTTGAIETTGESSSTDPSGNTSTSTTLTIASRGEATYSIVFASGNPAGNYTALLKEKLLDETGVTFSSSVDFRQEETEKEIILGAARGIEPELTADEIYVGVQGKKIVIAAGSPDLYDEAIELFISNLQIGTSSVRVSNKLEKTKEFNPLKLYSATVTVASFNIKNGDYANHDFRVLAQAIIDSGADIVGLQEVDYMTNRNQNQDTMALLSEYTGMEYYYYAPTIEGFSGGGKYGIAILSKYPILKAEDRSLPYTEEDEEHRKVAYAQIDVNGTKINFFNTHCDWTSLEKQFKKINEWTDEFDQFIVTGDFNCKNYTIFRNCFGNDTTLLFDESNLNGNIDNVLYSTSGITLNSFDLIKTNQGEEPITDHPMPVANLTIQYESRT